MSDEMIAHVLTDGDCLEEFHRAMERYGVTRSQLCALIGLDPACGEGGEGGRPIPRADLALGRLMVLNRFDHISLLERVRSVTQSFLAGKGLDAAALSRLAKVPLDQLEAFLSAPFPKDASLESAGCISPEHLYRLTVFVLTFGSLMGE